MSRFDRIEQKEIERIAKRSVGGGGGGGVTDHGALTGLNDDDHTQYHTDARGDARYSLTSHNHDHGTLTGLGDDDHTQYHTDARGDARYSQLGHTHDHGTLTGLGDDDHTQYHTDARGDARYSQLGHTHVLANVTDYHAARTDPTSKIVLVEDFYSNTLTTGLLGDLDWRFTNGSVSEIAADANHPGIIRRTSAATSANVASLYLGSVVTSALFRWDQFEECTFIFKMESLATNASYRFGITNQAGSSAPGIGVYIEGAVSSGSGNWVPVIKNGSSVTGSINSWAISTNWAKIKIRRISSTQAAFKFNNNVEVTETLGSPNNIADSAGLQWFMHIVPAVNTARSVDLDYFSAIVAGQTR